MRIKDHFKFAVFIFIYIINKIKIIHDTIIIFDIFFKILNTIFKEIILYDIILYLNYEFKIINKKFITIILQFFAIKFNFYINLYFILFSFLQNFGLFIVQKNQNKKLLFFSFYQKNSGYILYYNPKKINKNNVYSFFTNILSFLSLVFTVIFKLFSTPKGVLIVIFIVLNLKNCRVPF